MIGILYLMMCSGVLIGYLYRVIYKQRMGEEPRCKICDYDLTGLPRPRCPKCGNNFDGGIEKGRFIIGRKGRIAITVISVLYLTVILLLLIKLVTKY